MSVTIDSGEIPLIRNIDIEHQPSRSKVVTAWMRAMSEADAALIALEPILQDIRNSRLWEREHVSDPGEFLRQVGILKVYEHIDGVPQLLEEWIDKITNGESAVDVEHRISEQQSKQQRRQARDAKVIELRAAGKTQQQVADEVGVDRSRVGQIERGEKGTIVQETPTQETKAKEAGRHINTQKAIEAIRKVDPELADRADRGDIPVNTAKRQAGLIDQARITINAFKKCSFKERERVMEFIQAEWEKHLRETGEL